MTSINDVYIISYIPEGRKDRHKQREAQHKYLLDTIGDKVKINVLAMEWEPPFSDEHTMYYKCGRLRQAKARNFFLKQFYETDNDYAIFMDDDCIPKISKNLDILQVFEVIKSRIDFDVLSGRYNFAPPKDRFLVKLTKHISGGFFIIKNFRKHYGKEYYFDETINILEDQELGVRLAVDRYAVYECCNIILMSSITNKSTIYVDDNEDRKLANAQATKEICDKYSNILGYSIHTSSKHNKILREECGYQNIDIPIEEL